MTEETTKENTGETSPGNGDRLEQIVAEKSTRNCRSEKVGRRTEREAVRSQ